MDFKLNEHNQVEFYCRCRPVFLDNDGEEKKAGGRNPLEKLVNKFFESGTVKNFQQYVIPSIDLWMNDYDSEFLFGSKKEVKV